MTDILVELNELLKEIAEGKRNVLGGDELYRVLNRSEQEIQRLRKANSYMGWQLNPDRMGK